VAASRARLRRVTICGILLVGLIVRLAIAPWGGHLDDLASLTRWATAIRAHGLLAVYATSDANYPPLTLALLGLSARLHSFLRPAAPLTGPLWLLLLKLPSILADLGIGVVVYRLCRGAARCVPENGDRGVIYHAPTGEVSKRERTITGGIVGAAAVIFNPALIYLSAWWGQFESVYALCVLLTLALLLRRRPAWAGIALGCGLLVKLQAAAIIPLAALVVLTPPPSPCTERGLSTNAPGRLAAFVLGMVLAPILALGPYALTGQLAYVWARLTVLLNAPGWLTVNALNGWYLFTGGRGNWAFNAPLVQPDTAPLVGPLPARIAGSLVLGMWTLSVLLMTWRHARRRSESYDIWFLAGALLYAGVFLWPTKAHERYLFVALPLLAGAWATGRPRIAGGIAALYGAFSLAQLLNLLWAAPFTPALEGWFAGNLYTGLLIAALGVTLGLWGWAALSAAQD
jgi:dolichyl-phosphate-mannose-protein mannosyltransferase